jgi:SAM-dependent methyltransferase
VTTFDLYAACYDLLYEDKPYDEEAAFVARLVHDHAPRARSILELGCGTGKHALALARKGFSLVGIDRSSGMVARANAHLSEANPPPNVTVSFEVGDVRTVRFDRKFDAVVSLFHVMSYQTTDRDLIETIRTAVDHLTASGVFLFDCWYGPAVLNAPPEVRTKRCENSELRVARLAEPVMHPGRNVVDVHYTVSVEEKVSGEVTAISEVHPMRYLFYPEVDAMLTSSGLKLRHACEWMSGKELGPSTWSATFVAVKQ